jgi:hypothetical protein
MVGRHLARDLHLYSDATCEDRRHGLTNYMDTKAKMSSANKIDP